VHIYPREAADEFLIVACDGVWDVMSSQEAVDFVRERLNGGDVSCVSSIVEELLDACISPDLSQTCGLGGDNMTAIVVMFQRGGLASNALLNAAGAVVGGEHQSAQYVHGGQTVSVDDAMVAPAGMCGCKTAPHPQ